MLCGLREALGRHYKRWRRGPEQGMASTPSVTGQTGVAVSARATKGGSAEARAELNYCWLAVL